MRFDPDELHQAPQPDVHLLVAAATAKPSSPTRKSSQSSSSMPDQTRISPSCPSVYTLFPSLYPHVILCQSGKYPFGIKIIYYFKGWFFSHFSNIPDKCMFYKNKTLKSWNHHIKSQRRRMKIWIYIQPLRKRIQGPKNVNKQIE